MLQQLCVVLLREVRLPSQSSHVTLLQSPLHGCLFKPSRMLPTGDFHAWTNLKTQNQILKVACNWLSVRRHSAPSTSTTRSTKHDLFFPKETPAQAKSLCHLSHSITCSQIVLPLFPLCVAAGLTVQKWSFLTCWLQNHFFKSNACAAWICEIHCNCRVLSPCQRDYKLYICLGAVCFFRKRSWQPTDSTFFS